MGKAKLQAELGLSTREEAEDLFNQYHENVPFVRELMNSTSTLAQVSGSIGTLLGRRCRFNKWEPNSFWYAQTYGFVTKQYQHMD